MSEQDDEPTWASPFQAPSTPKEESGEESQGGNYTKLSDRILSKELRRRGLKVPRSLQNVVVKKSKKGPVGQLVIRRITGIDHKSSAAMLVKRFEENVGGRDDVEEKLSCVKDNLPKDVAAVLALMKLKPGMKLPRVIAEAGADVAQVMSWYAKGAIYLGQVECAIEAHRNMPKVVKDLISHALDQTDVCTVCYGTGTVAKKHGAQMENETCPLCRGSKYATVSSKHKEFAVQKLLEITKMVEKGPLVSVNQQVGVKVDGSGVEAGALSKVAHLADEILYGRRPLLAENVVDAEVVK